MSDLLGAWSLSVEGLSESCARDEQAMLEHLPGRPSLAQVRTRCLWLCAAPGKLAQTDQRIIGVEGFVATGGEPLTSYLTHLAKRRIVPSPEGHYALVHVDLDTTTMTLVRSLSGGERLYLTRIGDTVWFSTCIRPLLAHRDMTRDLDRRVVNEVLLTGAVLFGHRTPFERIDEVPPGHALSIGRGVGRPRWRWREPLRSLRGDPHVLAAGFRQSLTQAVERCVGRQRPVAVALSGGIDSSAIAAAAVDVVGADGVHAFTYEFDDPKHGKETHHARRVCKRLGIRRHEVFPIGRRSFLDAIPEMIWRTESSVHWPKAFLLPVARHIASRGYDRVLTGFGIGSHMAYLRELSTVLRWLPKPSVWLRYWRWGRVGDRRSLAALARIHPGLEPPHPRLYLFLLRLLEHEGKANVRAFFPRWLHPLLEDGPDLRELEPTLAAMPRVRRFQLTAFSHLVSCVDVTRSEKAMREVGISRVSPAHMATTIPYAYFPYEPLPRMGDPARRQRPGKHLLQLAYREVLPPENLYRAKSWSDAVVSRDWLKEGRVLMLQVLKRFPEDMRELGPDYPSIVRELEPTTIHANCLSFWFWRHLFVERDVHPFPPTWRTLMG